MWKAIHYLIVKHDLRVFDVCQLWHDINGSGWTLISWEGHTVKLYGKSCISLFSFNSNTNLQPNRYTSKGQFPIHFCKSNHSLSSVHKNSKYLKKRIFIFFKLYQVFWQRKTMEERKIYLCIKTIKKYVTIF